MRKIIIYILFAMLFTACGKTEKTKVDVSGIPSEVKAIRFEKEFYKANKETLSSLKEKRPLFFPQEPDSIWLNKIYDKDEQELFKESQKIYANFSDVEGELENLFKHVKYYNPDYHEPKVYTVLTNMDSRIVYADTLLVISLDNFLGKDHPFYADYPKYVRENNTKKHLVVDVANEIINKQVSINSKRSFLDKLIYEGKKMYLLDAYLPEVSDELKIGYSLEKMKWAKSNEEQVWKYFISKDYLYSTDSKLSKRFIDQAPFSKFYMEDDTKSPGQIGVFIGWQIVRSFMRNNDVSLPKLRKIEEVEIFKKSKYKPAK